MFYSGIIFHDLLLLSWSHFTELLFHLSRHVIQALYLTLIVLGLWLQAVVTSMAQATVAAQATEWAQAMGQDMAAPAAEVSQ
jgi:hypothetical protein